MNVAFFLLGDYPAPEFYVPTFRNILSVLSSYVVHTTYEDGTECSETSANKIQTQRNHPKERIQQYILFHLTFLHDNKRNELPSTLLVVISLIGQRVSISECHLQGSGTKYVK